MEYGFVRTAAATTPIRVADCEFNSRKIIEAAGTAAANNVEMIVFPELCITGYTCGDLFHQSALLSAARTALLHIAEETAAMDLIIIVGLPFENMAKLYNCAAVLHKGRVLGIVPKTSIPNYNEFYEKRYFETAPAETTELWLAGAAVPFGTRLLFRENTNPNFCFSVEICEDLWGPSTPSSFHAQAGASIIANPSAGNEITGKSAYRRTLVSGQSARLICTYIYAGAGSGESTTDLVFSGHNIIAENGKYLAESPLFEDTILYADTDVDYIANERRKNTTYSINSAGYKIIPFTISRKACELNRYINPYPFVPSDAEKRAERCAEILNIQAAGLKRRIEHTGVKNVILGISGGLDSTHALMATVKAFEMSGLPNSGIITVTMPSFGTSGRTYDNAVKLCRLLGTTFYEVDIKAAVMQHFKDIGHSPDVHDLTYENSQARERTQVLMDMASKYKGFVVGTGDLSELALGFATYNGDHMSMYGINCSVPKTLIRYLIGYAADAGGDAELKEVLCDILETPVSPELLPPKDNGSINQITEDIVGPYELHDFFLYNMMRLDFEPDKIFHIACIAFKEKYSPEIILKWLKSFYYRFFAQQFKRSAMPDGPKVGSVALSPRGDWRMPSDASVNIWIDRLDSIEL